MKFYISSLLFLISCCDCIAQLDTLFLDKKLIETKKETADYYRLKTPSISDPEMTMVEDYYMGGQLRMSGSFMLPKGNIKHGWFVYYFQNGKKSSEGNFEKGQRVGNWTYWHKNGVKKETRFFETPEPGKELSQSQKVIQLWDSTGLQLVTNGTGDYQSSVEDEEYTIEGRLVNSDRDGEWFGRYENDSLFFREKYQQGVLISGVSYDSIGTEYHYKELVIQPEPSEGLPKFYSYISKNLKYPKSARRSRVEGNVFVQFFINEEGEIVDVEVLKGIGEGCDEAAKEVISGAPHWKPAMHRGQRIKVEMILPITFKIH
ncbi:MULTISPECIES: energy transducer TonB [unclassified Imperialibacter]|uniref:energy transducer TonB n=1 Tax=unclassified Imperialibacter TaxID=2629706 RepID=UPI001253A5FB|nr:MULTISPECIES: energy transducer TonB [unclassified Imperialibacter]CAD5253249.1 putative TonB family protein [Imperialibacter sp. 75]CAD5285202.1 putative TonB family protein [Imperialibacter sp. 89]VVT23110.1 putative TonB family protein [Imperialibacter sp. EC-SDR9]